ncbi:cadherin-like beta sandwich domain-containing protein [Anaerovorax odorimutans]|uniref:cadherin-like beta sandwich domain-containing protein n=1 Tax=Anaerovorax odorimutans TaxID=109327 RepID=UPI0004278B0F|nr:cadherin-like beta sandwich domain-containing protein [Anaerovorax odorimutans]
MKKIISYIICFTMFLTCIPMNQAWADDTALPQTPEAYAQSDYAKYRARMTAGENHMAAVKADGTVVAWGGDNIYKQADVPEGLSDVKAIAAGTYNTLALKEDGTIVGWGSVLNESGETVTYTIPEELKNVEFKSIAAGNSMSAAVKKDGSVVVWGSNHSGDYGLENVPDLSDVVTVEINDFQVAALDTSGKVTCWGESNRINGAPTGEGFVDITSGGNIWLALKKDGTVAIWGVLKSKEKKIINESNVKAIAAGHRLALALFEDRSIEEFTNYRSSIPSDLNKNKLNEAENVAAIFVTTEYLQTCNALIMQTNGKVVAYSSEDTLLKNIPEGLNLLSNSTPQSSDADLSDLAALDYNLSPKFDKGVTQYAISLPNNVSQVAVTATTSSVKAALTVNEEIAESGTAYTVKDLKVGDNNITVKVTAEDGTVKTYTIKAVRAGDGTEKSNDADLSGLDVESYELSPEFDKGVTQYAISLPNNVSQVAVTATTSSVKAALTVNEETAESGTAYTVKDLKVGDNNITVKVTAEDGTVKTYTIKAVRAGDGTEKSNDADLSGLSVEGYDLNSDFTSEVINYEFNEVLPNNVTQVAVTATTSSVKASMTINDEEGENGTAYNVSLYVGANDIDIKVTAENGDVKTYTITVNVEEYDGPSPGIPQSIKAYNDSEYAHALDKVVGEGNFIFINQDGSVTRYKNLGRYPVAMGQYDLPDNLNHVKKVIETLNNLVALKDDGTVVAWGSPDTGLCNVPEGLKGVTNIETGFSSDFCIALKEDSTVVVWGKNDKSQCTVPEGLSGVRQILGGYNCCLVLKEDGTVKAWGSNYYGLCDVPEGLNGVTDIAIDSDGKFALALKEDGTVAAWGSNEHGECNVPSDLNNVAYIRAEIWNAIAVKKDGSVVIWGDNDYGLCDVPEGLRNVVSISNVVTGCIAVLKADGTVAAWGNDSSVVKNMPAGLHDIVAVRVYSASASGTKRIHALKKDGTVSIWGSNWEKKEVYLSQAKDVVYIGDRFVIYRGGDLDCYYRASLNSTEFAELQEIAGKVNVLSGHYFSAHDVELNDSEGKSATSVTANGTYKINAKIDNYYCEDTKCNVIIQVRGGEGAEASGGGNVISCSEQNIDVPLEGSTVSADFTMPENISGHVYVDVFAWDKGDNLAPRAEANQSLKIKVD